MNRLEVGRRYLRGFEAIAQACLLVRAGLDRSAEDRETALSARGHLEASLVDLRRLADEFEAFSKEGPEHAYTVYLLLGWERLRALHEELSARFKRLVQT